MCVAIIGADFSRGQGQLVCAPDEIAYRNGWISADQVRELAARIGKTEYSRRLLDSLH